jgi:hypothetical protein
VNDKKEGGMTESDSEKKVDSDPEADPTGSVFDSTLPAVVEWSDEKEGSSYSDDKDPQMSIIEEAQEGTTTLHPEGFFTSE